MRENEHLGIMRGDLDLATKFEIPVLPLINYQTSPDKP